MANTTPFEIDATSNGAVKMDTGAISTDGNGNLTVNGTITNSALTASLAACEKTANKNQPNGYAGVDSDGDLVGIVIFRNDTYTNLATFVPAAGQPVYATDTKQVSVGDGTTAFASLTNIGSPPNSLTIPTSLSEIVTIGSVSGSFAISSSLDGVIFTYVSQAAAAANPSLTGGPYFHSNLTFPQFTSDGGEVFSDGFGDLFVYMVQSSAITFSPSAGSGAGTSPSVTTVVGSNMNGLIHITTGTSPAASAAVMSFALILPPAITSGGWLLRSPVVILSPANAAAAALYGGQQVYASVSGTTVTVNSNTTALAASTSYKWYYKIEA
jgi:hypothetical protein